MKFSNTVLTVISIAVCAPCALGGTVVGYVNHTFDVGGNLFTNPLQDSSNTLSTLFSSPPPDGTSISLWNSTTSTFDTTSTFASGTWSIDFTLDPGTGARLTSTSTFVNTFIGTALNHDGTVWDGVSALTPPSVFSGPSGLYLIGDKSPMVSTGSDIFLNILGRLPNVGEQVISLSTTSTYLGGGTWDTNPSLGVSDAAFLNVEPVAVPEPSTLVATSLLLGLFGVAGLRRRLKTTRAAAKQILSFVLLALLSILASRADAGQIGSLFNTGVDASGHVLTTATDGPHSISDPHYSLFAVPGGTTVMEVYNYDQWLPGGPNSAWITPNEYANGYSANDAGPPGVYDYRTTFDLTGFDPSTASISGKWTADNQGTDILINGNSTGQQSLANLFYSTFSPFSITSHFVSGTNTLDFLVVNQPGPPSYLNNPTGLRVEFLSATADPAATSAIPEPSAFVMASILSGMFYAAWSYRRLTRAGSTA